MGGNKNEVSITQTQGEEKSVKCCLGVFRGQIHFQYDYAIQIWNCSAQWLKRLKNVADGGMNG